MGILLSRCCGLGMTTATTTTTTTEATRTLNTESGTVTSEGYQGESHQHHYQHRTHHHRRHHHSQQEQSRNRTLSTRQTLLYNGDYSQGRRGILPPETSSGRNPSTEMLKMDEYLLPVPIEYPPIASTGSSAHPPTSSTNVSFIYSEEEDEDSSTDFTPRHSHDDGKLFKVAVPWRTPLPLTATQLARKRAEFWETAPAYGGSIEVWEALHAAVAIGDEDLDTASTILACAGVILPKGRLTEAYDERGHRYVIPPYCLADPINGLISERERGEDELEKEQDRKGGKIEKSSSITSHSPTNSQHHHNHHHNHQHQHQHQFPPLSTILSSGAPHTLLIIRLSSGLDVRLSVPIISELCIGHLGQLLQMHVPCHGRVEFFWAGRGPLRGHVQLEALGIFCQSVSTPPLIQAWILPQGEQRKEGTQKEGEGEQGRNMHQDQYKDQDQARDQTQDQDRGQNESPEKQ